MPTALAARKHGSEEGSKDDDLGNTPSSDKEERDGDSQEANRARKRKEKNFRRVSSTTVDSSHYEISQGRVKRASGDEQDEVNSAPSTSDETRKRKQQQAQRYQAREETSRRRACRQTHHAELILSR
jgi:hypothetical protein